jgi:glycosyltransferase involved in cell wall biosynthesis
VKILYVITKSESGGAQTHIAQLAEHMKSLGHQVGVMSHPGGSLESKIQGLGISFFPNQFLSNSFNVLGGFRAMREIRRVVSEFHPDLISLHSSAAGFWGRVAIRNSVPTIFTAHGWGFTTGTPFFRKLIAVIAEAIVAMWCDAVICVSSNDRTLALRYHIASKKKLVTVHNGVEKLSNPDSVPVLIPDKKELIFVGRLAEPKQPEALLRAYASLPAKLKESTIVTFIGDGPKRSGLEALAQQIGVESHVRFLGDIPRADIFSYFMNSQTSKMFVLVSCYEGLPRSILEAMSCGLPIISSDVGGVREMVDDTNGILIPRHGSDELVVALKSLLSDPVRMQAMGNASKQKAEAEFTLPMMFEKTLAVYDRVHSS